MNTRKITTYILLVIACLLPLGSAAQEKDNNDYDRSRYVKEIRNYKHEFLSHELDLDSDRQQAFFELYDAMEDELLDLNEQTREIERRINADPNASEAELQAAADELFGQKAKEAEIEARYYELFKQKLTPRQLFMLKSAERNFNQQLMRQHRRSRVGVRPDHRQ